MTYWRSNAQLYCLDYQPLDVRPLQSCDRLDAINSRQSVSKPFSDAFLKATCIYYDRSPKLFGYYYREQIGLPIDRVRRLMERQNGLPTVKQPSLTKNPLALTYYQINDPILIKKNSAATFASILPFPVAEANGFCSYERPALFTMQNQTVTCLLPTDEPNFLNCAFFSGVEVYKAPNLKETTPILETFLCRTSTGSTVSPSAGYVTTGVSGKLTD
jgi:hypothetical protein